MSNDKKEEKWTFNFRDDQCSFIVSVMEYMVARCDERIGCLSFQPFERFTAKQVKVRAEEIISQISEVTS